jgi:hypothetical protein
MFQRQKNHKGPQAECAECMGKIAEQDAAYAGRVNRAAEAAKRLRNKIAKRSAEQQQSSKPHHERIL